MLAGAPCALPGGARTQPTTLEWSDPQLDTGQPPSPSIQSATCSIQAATSQIQLSGSIGEPAFPSRPGSAQATARNEGDGRSRATRSHAQSALAHEHGEDGEHRTFSAVSTVAHSSPVGGRIVGRQHGKLR